MKKFQWKNSVEIETKRAFIFLNKRTLTEDIKLGGTLDITEKNLREALELMALLLYTLTPGEGTYSV